MLSVDLKAARQLQVIPERVVRDHALVKLVLAAKLDAAPTTKRRTISRDAMMKCLRQGTRREQFIQVFDSEHKNTTEEEWKAAAKELTPDRMYQILVEALQVAESETFPYKQKVASNVLSTNRVELLHERRRLREIEAADEMELLDVAEKNCGPRPRRRRSLD
jgi:hypothetical protein